MVSWASLQRFLVLPDLSVKDRQIVGGNRISRIGPPPELVGLNRLVEFSGDDVVVVG